MCTARQKTQELVALAKEGDASAVNTLYAVYAERVRRIVRLRMPRELSAKLDSMDVVQDALFSALKRLEQFTYTSEGDFLRWLARVAQNALHDRVDKLHADKRDIRREVRLDYRRPAMETGEHAPPQAIETTTPSALMSRKEELDRLEEAMHRLKPEYRQVVILAKIEGLSYGEIGDQLGKSPDAVKMLVSRAIVALASAYESV